MTLWLNWCRFVAETIPYRSPFRKQSLCFLVAVDMQSSFWCLKTTTVDNKLVYFVDLKSKVLVRIIIKTFFLVTGIQWWESSIQTRISTRKCIVCLFFTFMPAIVQNFLQNWNPAFVRSNYPNCIWLMQSFIANLDFNNSGFNNWIWIPSIQIQFQIVEDSCWDCTNLCRAATWVA